MLGLRSIVLLSAALGVFAGHHHHAGQYVLEKEQEILGIQKAAGKRVAVIGGSFSVLFGACGA
jgi:hypothetical protein